MLSGLVVNAGIYILHQNRGFVQRMALAVLLMLICGDAAGSLGAAIGKKSPLQLYIRAFKDGIPILIHLLKLKSIGFANR